MDIMDLSDLAQDREFERDVLDSVKFLTTDPGVPGFHPLRYQISEM
jgi:hypothetical protein